MKRLLLTCLAGLLAANPAFGDNAREQEARAEIAKAVRLAYLDIKTATLDAIKTNYNLSDDEFSELIVLVAEDFKTGKFAFYRPDALGALEYFGTTNALEYLRNEALQGPLHFDGAKFHAMISGFDRNSFELARQVYSGEDSETTSKNRYFCDILRDVIESNGEYRGRKLAEDAKELALEYIRDSAAKDKERPRYFDTLLLKIDPDYPNSELRRQRVTYNVKILPTIHYSFAYFQAELAKIKKADEEAERKTAAAAAIAETELLEGPDIWLYSLITLATATVLTVGIVLRKNSAGDR